ncbi:MAG TPA: glycosyltransferase, partial [Polyangiaceae bacterium]|nr:glycosyltransferase [Polyangiaceae bacterium]
RAEIALDAATNYLIYPGDLETSAGAETTALLAERLARSAPEAVIVFAYRRKSPRATRIAAELAGRLAPERTRFVENTPHILALVRGAGAVVFPVDDLWGKVDLPIVLLEAMELGVPVIALDRGPLEDLFGVVKVPTLDAEAWEREACALLAEPARRELIARRQREALDLHHRASSVARAYEDSYLELIAESR